MDETLPIPDEPGGKTAKGSELSTAIYEHLRAMAHQQLARERPGHTLQTEALVHETLLKFTTDGKIAVSDRPTFFRAAAGAMRNILIDHARARNSKKRGGNRQRIALDGLEVSDGSADVVDLLALDEAICRLELQMADAAAVVRHRFYAGLSIDETAESLGISARSVDRLWSYARAWLFRELRDHLEVPKSPDPSQARDGTAGSRALDETIDPGSTL